MVVSFMFIWKENGTSCHHKFLMFVKNKNNDFSTPILSTLTLREACRPYGGGVASKNAGNKSESTRARLQLCLASRYNNHDAALFDASTLSRESHELILAIFRRVNAIIRNIRIYFFFIGRPSPQGEGGRYFSKFRIGLSPHKGSSTLTLFKDEANEN